MMEDPISDKSEKSDTVVLHTNGSCFICFKRSRENRKETQYFSLVRIICRYLQISVRDVVRGKGTGINGCGDSEILVSLCEQCEQMYAKLFELHQALESIQLEMSACFGTVAKLMDDTSNQEKLLKQFRERMKEDRQCVKHLSFVEALRKLIVENCLRPQSEHLPVVPIIFGTPPEEKENLSFKEFSEIKNDPMSTFMLPAEDYPPLDTDDNGSGNPFDITSTSLATLPVTRIKREEEDGSVWSEDVLHNEETHEKGETSFVNADAMGSEEQEIKLFPSSGLAKDGESDPLLDNSVASVHHQEPFSTGAQEPILPFSTSPQVFSTSSPGPSTSVTKFQLNLGRTEQFMCTLCEVSFDTEKGWKTHQHFHKRHPNFKCNFCEKIFPKKATVESHQQSCIFNPENFPKFHMQPSDEDGKRNKSVSGKRKRKANAGSTNFDRANEEPGAYKCCFCDTVLSYWTDRSIHIRTHHLGLEGPDPYQCEVCLAKFVSKLELNHHQQRQHAKNT